MKQPNIFVAKLEALQAEYAKAALAKPAARDAFEYGRVSGIHLGLEMAKELVLDILNQEEERGRSL